ncbi:MAG: PEP-CTERM sorting domain-containing protein [Chthoniobacteraceae bacterium]
MMKIANLNNGIATAPEPSVFALIARRTRCVALALVMPIFGAGTLSAQTGITFDSVGYRHEASSIITGTPPVGSETRVDEGGIGALTPEELAGTSLFGQALALDFFEESIVVNGGSQLLEETRVNAVARDDVRFTPPVGTENPEFSLRLSAVVSFGGQRQQSIFGAGSDFPAEAIGTSSFTIRFSLLSQKTVNLDLSVVRFDRLTGFSDANPLLGQPISMFENANAFSIGGSTELRFTRIGGGELDSIVFADPGLETLRGELAGSNRDFQLEAGQYELSLRSRATGDWTLPVVDGETGYGFEYELSANALLTFNATQNLWQGGLGETASFTNDAKWSKGNAPTIDEEAHLGPGFSTITLPGDVSHRRLVSELGGAHEFTLGGRTFTLTAAGDALRISQGVVSFSNGGVQAGGTSITGGQLLLGAGTTLVGTEFSVSGDGQARLTAGADAAASRLLVSPEDPAGGGGLFLSGAGTTFSSTNGGTIRGTVDVREGAVLTFGDDAFVVLSDFDNDSSALLIADGAGTEVSGGSSFSVLRGALMIVRNDAVFATGGPGSQFDVLGGEADFLSQATLGNVSVRFGGAFQAGANAVVAADSFLVQGSSTAEISAGGRLETTGGLQIGLEGEGSDAESLVRVTGAGSNLTVGNSLSIGLNSSGALFVENGASADLQDILVLITGSAEGGLGRLAAIGADTTVTGGNYTVFPNGVIAVADGASLAPAPGNTFVLAGGTAQFGGRVTLDRATAELGALLQVTAGGLVTANDLRISRDGSASISSGGQLESKVLVLGSGLPSPSRGDLTVTGVGSRLTVAERFNIDFVGAGLLSATEGATIAFGSSLIFVEGNEDLGRLAATGAGTTVTGGNYTVRENGLLFVADGARLESKAGGTDEIAGGSADFLNAQGSFATLSVSLGGSLNLRGSSRVSATSLAASGASVFVETGSRLVSPDVRIGSEATLGGAGVVQGNVVLEGGSILPGSSPGILTIEGDLLLSSGRIVLEIGGLTPGTDYDQLLVSGDFALDGGEIEFAFIDGFEPLAGQTFTIFDVGGMFVSDTVFSVSGLEPGWEFRTGFDPALGSFGLTSLTDGIATVPEPSACALIALGTGMVLFRRRERRLFSR